MTTEATIVVRVVELEQLLARLEHAASKRARTSAFSEDHASHHDGAAAAFHLARRLVSEVIA